MSHIEVYDKEVKDGLVRITQVGDSIQLGFIESILESERIDVIINRKGSGSYLNVYSGFNFQGIDVFIRESDYDKAKDILENVELTHEEDDEEYKTLEEEYKASKKKHTNLLLAPVVIAIVAAGLALIINLIKG